MRYQFEMTLRRAEGALVRVLGTTERRGFRPVSFEGDAHEGSDHWNLRMTVEGDRAAIALQGQLAKLYDCLSVEVSPCR
ncbi:ACT domain-containing protein [Luteimonas terrae]|uniref:Acetolactate synthase II small subunit n=1 Tax=Luteimonas terrae TaxID=1530191 RepID=A0ABU1XY04_9GAMM|nr:ACT domain-containing protein [Luteimonas terrae]MDR7193654.1 acetolactate synthase II small subunit [Luteimonas terrae]